MIEITPPDQEQQTKPEPVTPFDEVAEDTQASERNAFKGLPIQEIPVDKLTLSNDVPQFKDGANESGVVEPLGGKFDRTGVAPIQVWQRNDGRMEVISGRHRLDLARRSGESTIPVQVHREADGFDADRASTLDAELNIRDGQGKVADYVQYFTKSGIDKETANNRGLLSRAIGKRAYAIATQGDSELIAAHRANVATDLGAYAIATAFPNDGKRQQVALARLQQGDNVEKAVNVARALSAITGGDSNMDMFGFDDAAIKEAERMAKEAVSIQRQITNDIAAVQGAAKNPKAAAKFGVNVSDPDGVKKRIEELKAERAQWDNWHTNPALVAQLRGEEAQAVEPIAQAQPNTAQDDFLTSYDESTIQSQEANAKALAQQQAAQQNKEAIDAGVDNFSLDMGNVPDDDGGATFDMFSDPTPVAQPKPTQEPAAVETKVVGDKVVMFSRSAMKSVDANIKRGIEAMNKAITEKTNVHRAMYRNDIGWIDFVWGDEGVVKPNGKTKGAMGLSHVIEARMRKDNMTYDDVMQLMPRLVEAVAKGSEIRRSERDNSVNLVLGFGDVEVILVKNKGSNTWVMNGWEVRTVASKAAYEAHTATHNKADSSDNVKGAVLNNEPDSKEAAYESSVDTSNTTTPSRSITVADSHENTTTTNLTKQQATDIISRDADGKRLLKNGKVKVLGSIDEAPAHVLEQAKRSEVASDTIMVDGVERPTRNSNGQLIHPTKQGIENFWRWFGDSQVVDADGKPLVVYHYTPNDVFEEFDRDRIGETNRNTVLDGFFFADKQFPSSSWNKFETYLKIENAYDIDVRNSDFDTVGAQEAIMHYRQNGTEDYLREYFSEYERYDDEEIADKFSELENADGAILRNVGYDVHENEFIVFESNQIKSAIGNNGDFDHENKNIFYSQDGNIQGFFDPATDTTYLVADALTADTIQGVLVHEVGVHAWWAKANSDKKAALEKRAMQLLNQGKYGNEKIKAFYAAVEQRMIDADVQGNAEEAAAYIVEEAINQAGADKSKLSDSRLIDWVAKNISQSLANFLSDFISGVRASMHRIGWLKTANLTGADLVAIAKRNMREVAQNDVGDNVGILAGNVAGNVAGNYAGVLASMASDTPTQAEIAQAQRDLNTQLAIADKLEAEYGYLPAPNGEKSNLNRLQWSQVRTPQFKEFYGDWEKNGKQLGVYRGGEKGNDWRGIVGSSETIATANVRATGGMGSRNDGNGAGFTDGNGEPVIFYHGTSDDVVSFDTNHKNRKDKGWLGRGVYVTDAHPLASMYAKQKKGDAAQNVMPLFVGVKKPLMADIELKHALKFASQSDIDLFTANAISAGYDGVVIKFPNGVNELVSFNQNAVKSAIGNVGTFSGKTGKINFSKAGTTKAKPVDQIDEIQKAVDEQRSKLLNRLKVSGVDHAGWMLGIPNLKQLADIAKHKLPQIQEYTEITDRMAGYRNKLMTESGDIANDVRKWVGKNRAAANRLFDLMHEATISGIDPSEPYKSMDLSLLKQKQAHLDIMQGLSDDHAAEIDALEKQIQYELSGERRADYDALAKKWALIPNGGRRVFQLMRDHYKLRALQTQKELLARIARSGLDDEMKQASMGALRLQFESTMNSGVYFPLARFGEYWLSGKNPKGERELRMYDNESERRTAERKMIDLGYTDVASGVKLDANALEAGANGAFVSDAISKLDEALGEDAKQLKDDIYQFYLQSLPDMSMRKAFIHRKKTKGYSADALRALL